MIWLKTPNVPQSQVVLCAIGAGNPYICEELQKYCEEVLELKSYPAFLQPVQRHADLLLHYAGEGRGWCTLPDDPAILRLSELGMLLSASAKSLQDETALCVIALEQYLIANPQTAENDLLKFHQSKGRELLAVHQGYARCSVCVVNSTSLITSDQGIIKAAGNAGLDVLEIRPGYIALPGYAYGFIGGCSGLLAPDLLAFYGQVSAHPDWAAIQEFCNQRSVQILELCPDHPLQDIGGILPLAEKA